VRVCCIAAPERIENIYEKPILLGGAMFFTFPEDARWDDEGQAVEFGVGIGEYEGVVRLSRRVFQRLLPESPTPEWCLEGYYLQRTRFETIAERKLHRRQLTEDGNVEITGRDLRDGGVLWHSRPSARLRGPRCSPKTSSALAQRQAIRRKSVHRELRLRN
jgi:hypothetical protein